MSRARAIRLLMSWLATLALLVSALAPAISVALPSGADPFGLADICSVQDMDAAWREGKPAPMSGKMDCKLCPSSQHAKSDPDHLPAPAYRLALRDALGLPNPSRTLPAPKARQAWPDAQPRAPPRQA